MKTGSPEVKYPTLFVPPSNSPIVEFPSSPSVSETSVKVDPELAEMNGDGTNVQKESRWFSWLRFGSTKTFSNGDNSERRPATTVIAQTVSSWLAQRYRPWTEFFKTTKFDLPTWDIAAQRIQRNLNMFLSNYLRISVVLLVYCVLTSFTLSLSLVALACLFYKIRQKTLEGPVVLAGHEVPNSLLYSLAIIICIPLFYWAGASQTIGWIMGSSIFLIFLHSALYVSEEQPEAELEAVTIA